MSIRRKVLSFSAVILAAATGLIALYTAFEYTLVPDVRERLAGAQSKEGIELGMLLFQTRGCSGCHSLGDLSTSSIGPDLTEYASNATVAQITESIVNPDAEISEDCAGQPCAERQMPNFGDILDDREIEALVKFLSAYGRADSERRD